MQSINDMDPSIYIYIDGNSQINTPNHKSLAFSKSTTLLVIIVIPDFDNFHRHVSSQLFPDSEMITVRGSFIIDDRVPSDITAML
jgi:hypothetical protein